MQSDSIPKDLKPMLLFNMLYNHSLELAAQPIVNLRTGKIEAVEILSRSPGEVLMPDEMFRLARQYGVLEQLTLLSSRKLVENVDVVRPLAPKGIFFNIEADVTKQTLEEIAKIFQSIPDVHIVLEITEHVPSGFPWRPFADAQGYSVAMDDLGKGNSNMVELMDMNPHFIKICMEIVRDLHKSGTKAIIIENYKKVGESMNSLVIAEGIETVEDMKKLKELGIELGQGFYFSRPCLINEIPIEEWTQGFSFKM